MTFIWPIYCTWLEDVTWECIVKHKTWKRLTGLELLCTVCMHLTFGICVSLYCAEVSLFSVCVCLCVRAQGLRAEWCQSKSVSVVPASSASLKIDLSRHRERGNTPLTPSFCLSLKNTKSPKQPHPHHNHIFPSDKCFAARARHRLTHSCRAWADGVGGRLAQRGIITLDGSRACRM